MTTTPTPKPWRSLLLYALLVTTPAFIQAGLPALWQGDALVEEANEQLNEAVAEGLRWGPGRRRRQAMTTPGGMPDVYFHDEERRLTVTARGVEAALPQSWKAEQVDVVLEEQRAELELLLPRVLVSGRYAVDKQAYGDFDAREEGTFVWELTNVTATGMAAVRLDDDALSLGRVVLKLKAQEETFEASRKIGNADLKEYTAGEGLGEGLRRRLWRDVTQHLEAAARSRLRPPITRRPLTELVNDVDSRDKLKRYVQESMESADQFVDEVLQAARKLVRENHGDKVKLPDLREGFERRVLMVRVHGSFWAGEGAARGVASVYRSGDATFARSDNGSDFRIWGVITFDDLRIQYDRYEAHFMGIGPSGTLSAEVNPLTLHVQIHVDFDNDSVRLEDFRVDEVGNLQVELTGLTFVLNWLASYIASWILAAYKDQVVNELGQRYERFFSDVLERTSLNDMVNGRAFL